VRDGHAAIAESTILARLTPRKSSDACRLRLIALIEEAVVIGRILRHLGLPTDLPVARPGAPQADEYESACSAIFRR
jgi:hypothetical protein